MADLDKTPDGARGADADTVRRTKKKWVQTYVETYLGSLDKQTARFRYLFRRLVKMMGPAFWKMCWMRCETRTFRPSIMN